MNHAEQTWPGGADAAILTELAREERARAALGTVLPQLVAADDMPGLAEEPVIRTRAALVSLATDLLRDHGGDAHPASVAELAQALSARPGLIAHCHALALEAGTAERIAVAGTDPVLAPLFSEFLAGDGEIAVLAMHVLAAQARFISRQRRMETVAAELPADLMHEALVALADSLGTGGNEAAAALRATFDEGRTRLSLLGRLALAGANEAERLLDPAVAGLALFATVLSQRAGVPREEAVLACVSGQALRLALLMRAAGAGTTETRAALAQLHPEAHLPDGLAELAGAEAAALLAGAGA